ncbi:hypothetical protein ATL41_0522 [Flavimobilis soli]|uniref:Tetratricopeptide repeat protein n=1 Tax=Flavimobilis soli TaxID=442709 RepID=A0A2A9EC06_9MICO|nr:hypothetical protein [Flavimobilis soli]PFG35825.1 hypothetical protein ATL41_0522 [Flavimobilis soli]
MVARLIDVDPELAYEHAQEAVRRGGRVDIVREAAGLAAYRTGRYAEALRELRTVRRLNGSSEHLPVMADCERGLERPERAIALAATPEAETLEPSAKVELAIVVSGARGDLGELDAALAVLDQIEVPRGERLLEARVAVARSLVHEAAGRPDAAAHALAGFTADEIRAASGEVDEEDDVVVYDLTEELVPEPETPDDAAATEGDDTDTSADTPRGDAQVADGESDDAALEADDPTSGATQTAEAVAPDERGDAPEDDAETDSTEDEK